MASTHNLTCPSLNSLSNVAYEENDYLTTLQDRGNTEAKEFPLGSELLVSESVSELPLAECSLSAPALFADSDMEVFHPPASAAASASAVASVTTEIALASSFLEETTEDMRSGPVEVCGDETVTVSSYKLWKEDCLLMVWSVAAKNGSELKSASLDIFPAENFQVSQ